MYSAVQCSAVLTMVAKMKIVGNCRGYRRLIFIVSIITTFAVSSSSPRHWSDDNDDMEKIISAMQPGEGEYIASEESFDYPHRHDHSQQPHQRKRRHTSQTSRYRPEYTSSLQVKKMKKNRRLKKKSKAHSTEASSQHHQQHDVSNSNSNGDRSTSLSSTKITQSTCHDKNQTDNVSLVLDDNNRTAAFTNVSTHFNNNDSSREEITERIPITPQTVHSVHFPSSSSTGIQISLSNHTIPQESKLPTSRNPLDYALSMTSPWVRQFLSTHPHDHLLPIPLDYLSDGFNFHRIHTVIDQLISNFHREMMDPTHGLSESLWKKISSIVYREAVQRLIVTPTTTMMEDPPLEESTRVNTSTRDLCTSLGIPDTLIEKSTEIIFLLVHARFVTSPRGIDMVKRMMYLEEQDPRRIEESKGEESRAGDKVGTRSDEPSSILPIFGQCPRLLCGGMPLLPCGLSDDYDERSALEDMLPLRALRYCCRCGETFYSFDSTVSGCAWGVSFCHLFLLTFGEKFRTFGRPIDSVIGKKNTAAEQFLKKADYSPRIFGFRLHPCSAYPFPKYSN